MTDIGSFVSTIENHSKETRYVYSRRLTDFRGLICDILHTSFIIRRHQKFDWKKLLSILHYLYIISIIKSNFCFNCPLL